MSRENIEESHVTSLGEEARFAVHMSMDSVTRRLRYVKFTARHREARLIQMANQQGRIEQTRSALRALELEFADMKHQDEECTAVDEKELEELGVEKRDFAQINKIITLDMRALGIKHTDAAVLSECSPAEQATV